MKGQGHPGDRFRKNKDNWRNVSKRTRTTVLTGPGWLGLKAFFLVVSYDSIGGFVRPSVGRLVRRSVTLWLAGRDKTAIGYCRVYEFVNFKKIKKTEFDNHAPKNAARYSLSCLILT